MKFLKSCLIATAVSLATIAPAKAQHPFSLDQCDTYQKESVEQMDCLMSYTIYFALEDAVYLKTYNQPIDLESGPILFEQPFYIAEREQLPEGSVIMLLHEFMFQGNRWIHVRYDGDYRFVPLTNN
ncbi:hypothetical protein [Leptothoe sp. PORK10 BA2]|uniref:hypothetical protein n=1 Tax=Leptothoe sp. PORK10 BA2 TaxID=3110254 RepID=UPI002B2194A4|nr:hypothetical protein [Leptothoe sp. PORK10 BA2]MEA5464625.1 hypothetical protein [Leptothoe sp. PORK10 BA2]